MDDKELFKMLSASGLDEALAAREALILETMEHIESQVGAESVVIKELGDEKYSDSQTADVLAIHRATIMHSYGILRHSAAHVLMSMNSGKDVSDALKDMENPCYGTSRAMERIMHSPLHRRIVLNFYLNDVLRVLDRRYEMMLPKKQE
ncbi:hypothetical protein KY363_00290 [Candidatus Woesearchaeota archaeon]|nr:hypothetical protein [Candidatus Woesearchaeota archaeon]